MRESAAAPTFSRQEAAHRSGVTTAHVTELVELGILVPDEAGRLTGTDIRRIGVVQAMLRAEFPLAGIGQGIRQGILSLDFVAGPEYDRFPTLSDESFEEAAARTGVPISLLFVIREAIGLGAAAPHDRMLNEELAIASFVDVQMRVGFQANAVERLLRAMGDSLRRIADSEGEWWRSQVLEPSLQAGDTANAVAGSDLSPQLPERSERALLAIYHAQQAQIWTANLVGGFAYIMANAGLYTASERNPAICFLDITGYTRLTQEHGDHAAADLAETLNRIVKRTSMQHGGRPVKWLGDGVMFHFPDPAQGVHAALDMLAGIPAAGLPPAHVGLDAGPVVLQEGDYYGRTVNLAARIAEYARPGEVLVSQSVVDASATAGLDFDPIGDVELKGVSGAVALHAARRGVSIAD